MVAFIGTYLVEENLLSELLLSSVLMAGYFLGRRMGVLAAVFSILVGSDLRLVLSSAFS